MTACGLIPAIDDIDDARHTRCVVGGRRIVDDLDALDAACGNAVEPSLITNARQTGLLAVDENRDTVAASQLNLSVLVHGDAGQAAHRIEDRARRARDIVA